MRLVFTLYIVLLVKIVSAQFLELGAFGGVSNYQGDLARVAFEPVETHLAYGAFTKFNFNKYLGAKASIYKGRISGNDLNSTFDWRQRRNLSFDSPVTEGALCLEYNVTGFMPHLRKRIFTPYVFAGIGLYHFNPRALYLGEWYDLQPLGTEGQGTTAYPERKPYKLTQYSIPLGIGFKTSVSKQWNIGIEMGWRKTFTDYLDDVSTTYVAEEILVEENGLMSWELSNRMDETEAGMYLNPDDSKLRGEDNNLDWYIFSGIIISYNFDLLRWDLKKAKYHDGSSKYSGIKESRKKMGCPGVGKK